MEGSCEFNLSLGIWCLCLTIMETTDEWKLIEK